MSLVVLENVGLEFGGRTLFAGLGLRVGEEDRIGVVGRNGSGKSSLLKIIAGAMEPTIGIVRGSRGLRIALLMGVPLAFVGYLALQSTERFAFAKFAQGYPAGHAIGCGLVALFFGALVAGGAMIAWRRTDPYSPGLSGAMIGMVGGLASGAGMTLACPSHEAFHSCFAHGMVVFALALLGFGFGRRMLAP